MRAVVMRSTGGSEVLRVESLSDPAPSPGQAVVEVAACGVCTLDVVTRRGDYRRNVELPLLLTHLSKREL